MQTRNDLWDYRSDLSGISELDGLEVEATDGSIGSIDEATHDVGASFIVVDTGPWIFGKKVLIPASAIQRIDLANRQVELGLTKDQIKDSPEFDETHRTPEYRDRVGTYYDPFI